LAAVVVDDLAGDFANLRHLERPTAGAPMLGQRLVNLSPQKPPQPLAGVISTEVCGLTAVGLTAALLTHAGHTLQAHPDPIKTKAAAEPATNGQQ
jgi:hypothetical protein